MDQKSVPKALLFEQLPHAGFQVGCEGDRASALKSPIPELTQHIDVPPLGTVVTVVQTGPYPGQFPPAELAALQSGCEL